MEVIENNIPLAPSSVLTYKEIVKEIGRHIWERKGILARRVWFIIWPGLLAIILIDLGYSYAHGSEIPRSPLLFWIGFSFSIYAFFHILTATFIFMIEKRIWADSYFDGQNLSPKQSWVLAKKLFFPMTRLGLETIRYFPAFPISIALLIAVILGQFSLAIYPPIDALMRSSRFIENTYIIVVLSIIFILIVILVVLSLKLRYLLFIFLDKYQKKGTNYKEIYAELRILNKVSEGELFNKALVAYFGTEAVSAILQEITDILLDSLFRATGIFGQAAKAYKTRYIREAKSFAQIIAFYLLYREARALQYGERQHINQNLYSIVD